MELERGKIFTPDKKKYLIDEVSRELKLVEEESRNRASAKDLQQVKLELQAALKLLLDKKGVVTPQETDEILDLIGKAKRARFQSDYYLGLKRSTFYLLAFVALGVGVYIYTKKRNP